MPTPYPVRYAVAPTLSFRRPLCTACAVEVDYDDDLICPMCGTSWPTDSDEDTAGTLYEDWSGETNNAPLTDPGDAWKVVAHAQTTKRQAARTPSTRNLEPLPDPSFDGGAWLRTILAGRTAPSATN